MRTYTGKIIYKTCTLIRKNKSFLIFILLMSVFRSAIADWYTIPSGSMMPTIEVGDRITVNKMAYDLRFPFSNTQLIRLNEPQRGDIVVFNSKAANKRLIKRVVALPGDRVSMSNGVLSINNTRVTYQTVYETAKEYVAKETSQGNSRLISIDKTQPPSLSNFDTVSVPQNHYLVLGDNRRNSADSRVYGFVPREELLGRATYVVFSLNYDNNYIPKSGRFIKHLYL